MTPAWRDYIRAMDKEAWWAAAGALVLAALVAFALASVFLLVRAGAAPTVSAPTYCAAAATVSVPKCPPAPGSVVVATWENGAVARAEWGGASWRLRVPGGERQRVGAPHDWREP